MSAADGFVTYAQMDSFLEKKTSIEEISTIFIEARAYFEENSQIQDYIDPMIPPVDIYACSDEMFDEITKKFPIPTFSTCFISGKVISSAFIPSKAECFLTRHLNHLIRFNHFHEFFEICYVMSGSCSHFFNGKKVLMQKGDIIIIPPLVKHSVLVQDKSSMIFNICIREETFNNTFFYILALNTPLSLFFRNSIIGHNPNEFLHFHTRRSHFLDRIIRHIAFDCYATTPTTHIFTSSLVSQLFEFILRDGTLDDKFYNPVDESFSVSSVIQYIQRNYRNVTLSKLTEIFNVNEAYLSRCIKKFTTYSFSELLYSIRIERARQLLIRTDCTLDTIAEIIGYSDSTSLSKAFKRKTGKSPLQYKKEYSPTTDKNAYF